MQQLKIKASHSRAFLISVSLFALQFLIFILNAIITNYLLEPIDEELRLGLNKGVIFGISGFLFQNSAVVYMITLNSIYYRLHLANGFLEELMNDTKISEKEVVEKLKRISVFIDRIGDTLDFMKICYTIKIIVYKMHFLFYSILCIYGWICYFFQGQSSYLEFVNCCITLLWQIYYMPCFIWVFLFSNLIEREGRKFKMLTSQISQKWRNTKVYKRARQSGMQLYHRGILIECGICVIDWKFLFVLMGLCFSYLLIIMQFEFKIQVLP